MPVFNPTAVQAELAFLKANPHFDERPASIVEFLKEDYLNIEDLVRPGLREALIDIFGTEVSGTRLAMKRYAMVTGAIGIGKTTFASIVLPYMVHWCLCLHSPQEFFHLLPGSRIAFMQMSTSEDQAKEVLFGDIDARIKHSKWFTDDWPRDPKFKTSIRYPQKDIWILPGDSQETTFEGYNILGGVLDEADSHVVTKDKDYADIGFDAIDGRISSRFGDAGLLIIIGQMKKANGFAARKYKEFSEDSAAHTVRMTIWESFGWDKYLNVDGTRNSFWYDIERKQIIPTGVAEVVKSEKLIEVPELYRKQFTNNPEKSLRDLAGIPPATGDPFISLTHKLTDAVERWQKRNDEVGSPVSDNTYRPVFAPWFICLTPIKRVAHIDLAYSAKGDALGLAMGHVSEVIDIDGELKPYVIFDFLLRMKAAPGTEIMLSDVRHIIYDLRDTLKFRLKRVTYDGFQSVDSIQQLRKRKFETDNVSVDKNKGPYEDLREAIYEDRIEWPPYLTYINAGDTQRVEIANKELMELTDDGKKIDHPENGSKDVADAMAGVVYTLMGDRSYRRGVSSRVGQSTLAPSASPQDSRSTDGNGHPALGGMGMKAPIPDFGSIGSLIPKLPPRIGR